MKTEASIMQLDGLGTADPSNPDTGDPTTAGGAIPFFTFFIQDHLGNSRILYHNKFTECSEQGVRYVLEHVMDYYPYGKTLREYTLERERFQSTHHERDEETGLDYRGARFYDSDLGRFLSLDPLAMDFPQWSSYNYVLGNPVKFIDPDGKEPEEGGDPIITYNARKVPKGGHLAISAKINVGIHTKEGLTFFGVGEKVNIGESVQIANAEILVGLEEAYVNFELFNKNEVEMEIGGNVIGAGGKITVSKKISSNEFNEGKGTLSIGPVALTVKSGGKPAELAIKIFEKSGSIGNIGGQNVSITFKASIEGIKVNLSDWKGTPATGFGLSNNHRSAWYRAQVHRLDREAEERAERRQEKKLRNRLNNLIIFDHPDID